MIFSDIYYVTNDITEYNHLTYNRIFPETSSDSRWCYKKTPGLFACLFALYDNQYNTNMFKSLLDLFDRPGAEVHEYSNIADALNGAEQLAAKHKAAIPERTGVCADG